MADKPIEWCFAVPSDDGRAEIRIRVNGEVVLTHGSPKWLCLDGITFPTPEWQPMQVVRTDVFRLDTLDSLEKTPLSAKAYLFHYTKAETALKHVLADRKIRLSSYSSTNDPRESRDWSFAVVDAQGKLAPGESLRISDEMSALLKTRCRVICFCADRPRSTSQGEIGLAETNGWTHARMWAQYANNHAGVVLVFDRRKLLENAWRALRSKGQLFFGQVIYVAHDHRLGLLPFVIDHCESVSVADTQKAQQHFDLHRDWLFFTKHLDWAQEQECRMLLFGAADALVEICMGHAAKNDEIACFQNFAAEFGSALSRVWWRNGLAVRCPITG